MVTNKQISGAFERNYQLSYQNIVDSAKRISSGKALTTDSPVNVVIGEKFAAKATENFGLLRNAQDAISMNQTKDGGLSRIGDSLQRIRELAVQYKNGTLTDDDRRIVAYEAQQMAEGIDDVTKMVEFNGNKVLSSFDSASLGVSGLNLGAENALEVIDKALATVNSSRATLGAQVNRQEANINNFAQSAIAQAAAEQNLRGVDLAREITKMTTSQMLMEAGIYAQKAHQALTMNRISAIMGLSF